MFQVSSVELASPEGEGEEVGGESKDAEGGGLKQGPVGFGTVGNVAELKNLKKGEGQGEEAGSEDG